MTDSVSSQESFLYTPAQRRRRDATRWTLVQGVLAPLQFLVFFVSLLLVINFLSTGEGLAAATWSVVIKTAVLYTIMVTGAIWEKAVFDQYLFAPAFYWEDVVSMLVIALHTAYLVAWLFELASPVTQMNIALAAYAVYVVNAAQFLVKLRRARLESERLASERLASERLASERLASERLASERLASERLASEIPPPLRLVRS